MNSPLRRHLNSFLDAQAGERPGAARVAQALADMLRPDEGVVLEDREKCERSLLDFVRGGWHAIEPHDFVGGWHIDCICEHLQAVTAGQISKLIVNMPPRHGKSNIVCVFWFCWAWATQPATRWLFTSYSDDLATRDSLKCLDVIRSQWYQDRWGWSFQLRAGQRAMSKFSNNRTGYRIASSVQGRGTGEGGDYVVTDDPNKASEVYSDTIRERVNRWWSETMSTRSGTNPKTVRKVIVQQRLHERELSGYTMASDLGYETLILPARYDPRRYFLPTPAEPTPKKRTRDMIVPTSLQLSRPELMDPRREEGELLWPQRFGPAEIETLVRELQAYGTAGQLDQRPSPAEGDIFKRVQFRYLSEESVAWKGDASKMVPCYTIHPQGRDLPLHIPRSHCRHFITADTALTAGKRSCYTAAGFFASAMVYRNEAVVARYLFVLDVVRDKLAVPQQFDFLLDFWRTHPEAVFLAVEPKASGIGLIQQSAAEGRPFRSLKVDGDSVMRAGPVSTLYAGGMVYHRQGMAMLAELEDELLGFPQAQYDDLCDVVGHAGICFTHDRILSAAADVPGMAYAPPEQRRGDRLTVAGVEIDFEDEPPEWWSR